MVPRRDLLAAACVAAAVPRLALGQPSATNGRPIVGVLVAGGPGPGYVGFLQGLADLGYAEGKNVRIESRFAESRFNRLMEMAAELVALPVDVIATIGAPTARAARQMTADIPIVFAIAIDPVGAGLVANPRRPGDNLTGATNFDPAEPRRQIGLLKEVLPHMTRLAILAEEGIAGPLTAAYRAAAEAEQLQPQVATLRGASPDLGAVFAAAAEARADAMLALQVPAVFAQASRIAEMAAAAKLPTMFSRDLADQGPMLAFGTSLAAVAQQMAALVDRILKGATPGTLPVEFVSRPELVVNAQVARAIGVTIPPGILARAHQVIE